MDYASCTDVNWRLIAIKPPSRKHVLFIDQPEKDCTEESDQFECPYV